MIASSSKPRSVVLAVAAALLVVFGAVVALMTSQLRARLRAEVLRREAEAIHAVAQMQLGVARTRPSELAEIDPTADLFTAVLESSRLRGVLAVQLFDANGAMREALPAAGGAISRWWAPTITEPLARFFAAGALETVYGLPPEPGGASRAPLVEVVVPLSPAPHGPPLGTARYWLDGAPAAAEFARMDRGLFVQAGIAFLGAAIALALVLAWALSRLAEANRRLLAQSADLARANQELDFAARTGAIGAISAHLIHGLKNPLAGIEGFVAENATAPVDPERGEAWRAAAETTRRLRALVNEVVTVLRDETAERADYRVPVDEVIAAAGQRAAAAAEAAGVELTAVAASRVEVIARAANLAGLVLANLLANAIEATPRGGRVKLTAGEADGMVEFFVSDTGAGLSASARSHLFQPLRSAKAGGGGVGLAISRQLARHANGDLELVRSDEAGTVFRLRIPAAAAAHSNTR